jgi:hypothetical protein
MFYRADTRRYLGLPRRIAATTYFSAGTHRGSHADSCVMLLKTPLANRTLRDQLRAMCRSVGGLPANSPQQKSGTKRTLAQRRGRV